MAEVLSFIQQVEEDPAVKNYFKHREPEKVSDDPVINDVANLIAAKYTGWMYKEGGSRDD